MITPGLERVIQSGKARMHTYTYGGGAVGRIPCPKGSFIIIHHFDYWHFIDVPESGGADAPAVGGFVITEIDETQTEVVGSVDLVPGDGNGFDMNFDFTDIAASEAAFNAAIATPYPGWSAVFLDTGENEWTIYVFTESPGEIYNGTIPSLSLASSPAVVAAIAFSGGSASAGVMTASRFLTHSSHQVEFRSNKGRNTFIIHEPVNLYFPDKIPDEENFVANLGGVYEKDTYLVHTDSIQINVLGVPDVLLWGVSFAPLDTKSKEFPEPVGYGIAGTPSQSTVREIFFDGAGATQQYLPLTSAFDSTTVTDYREQFKVDVNADNALFNPQNTGGIFGNFKTYPLVNIDYIIVDMPWTQFLKASNG